MTLGSVQPGFDASSLSFIPLRGDFPRGIFMTANLPCPLSQQQTDDLYSEYYSAEPFTRFSTSDVDMKQVVNTNKALVQAIAHEGRLLLICAIDNLLKGASGQAVENMNIMFGLPETAGLRLKASAF